MNYVQWLKATFPIIFQPAKIYSLYANSHGKTPR